jgi:hypothetical protein
MYYCCAIVLGIVFIVGLCITIVAHKNQINMNVGLKLVSFIKMYTYESLAPFQLKHEITMVVAGPFKSGKTEFLKQLVQTTHWISLSPEKIVWCYQEWQKAYESLQNSVTFVKNIPSVDEKLVADLSTPHLLIFDDMMGGWG